MGPRPCSSVKGATWERPGDPGTGGSLGGWQTPVVFIAAYGLTLSSNSCSLMSPLGIHLCSSEFHHLSGHPPFHPSVHLPTHHPYSSTHLSIHPLIYLPTNTYPHPFISLPTIHSFTHQSVHSYTHLFIFLIPIHPFPHLSMPS